MQRLGLSVKRRSTAIALIAAATAFTVAGCGGSSDKSSSSAKSSASSTALGSSYDVAGAGNVTLEMWWLADQETPGISPWMKETISKFEALHPNITVKATTQATDTYPAQLVTACKTGKGPDVWYNWGGYFALQTAWPGCIVPNEDVLSETDLKNVPAISGTKWSGKTWVYPIEQKVFPIIYNKDLFKKAGLDPAKAPETWGEFMTDLQALKKAGITPLSSGLKDGWGAENLAVALQRQVLSVGDLLRDTVDADMTKGAWAEWVEKAHELVPYFNNDATSLNLAQGLAAFQSGKAAMTFAPTGWVQTVISMDKAGKNVGVFRVPSWVDTPRAKLAYQDTPGYQVTKFSKHPEVAGAFMAYMHTPERLKALYNTTGLLPSDTQFTPDKFKASTDEEVLKWLAEGVDYYSANYYPGDLDVNGNFRIFQGMIGNGMSASEAAQTLNNVIGKWRKREPQEVDAFRVWSKDYPAGG